MYIRNELVESAWSAEVIDFGGFEAVSLFLNLFVQDIGKIFYGESKYLRSYKYTG